MEIKLNQILSAYASLGYSLDPVFNLFGIRAKDKDTNRFNDLIGFLYNDPETNVQDWTYRCFWGSTRPGYKALEEPTNKAGTAIMKSGFYPAVYSFGFHKNDRSKPCFKQTGKIKFYRDADRDRLLEMKEDTVVTAKIGANIHSTSEVFTALNVDDWSRGCQVVQLVSSLAQILAVAKLSGKKVFNYSLFLENEITN